jgi:hypothetical protein
MWAAACYCAVVVRNVWEAAGGLAGWHKRGLDFLCDIFTQGTIAFIKLLFKIFSFGIASLHFLF